MCVWDISFYGYFVLNLIVIYMFSKLSFSDGANLLVDVCLWVDSMYGSYVKVKITFFCRFYWVTKSCA